MDSMRYIFAGIQLGWFRSLKPRVRKVLASTQACVYTIGISKNGCYFFWILLTRPSNAPV